MTRKYRLVPVDSVVKLAHGSDLLYDDPDQTTGPRACAGGNRAAVGPRGTAQGRACPSRTAVFEQKESWDMSGQMHLEPEQLEWLSFDNMCSILDYFSFDLHDLVESFDHSSSERAFKIDALKTFLADDYMRCLELVAELKYRLEKL